jgi:hypothetical protein
VERRAELFDIRHDLRIHRVRQDDQRDLLGDLGKAGRHVRMRAPGRHPLIDHLRGLVPELDAVALAGPFERIVHHLGIGLPVAENLVKAIGGEVPHELGHARLVQLLAVEVARGFRHLEIGQRAVAVEGDVFRTEGRHALHPLNKGGRGYLQRS